LPTNPGITTPHENLITQWTRRQEEPGQESQKQKTSSQEETDTTNVWEVAEKGDTLEDPSKRMGKGKSLPVSFVENRVTSQEIADRNDTAIKGSNARTKDHHEIIRHRHVPGKLIKMQKEPSEA
jgi:hypothetical protein